MKDIKVLLNVFRSFISCEDLFHLLQLRFNVPPLKPDQSLDTQKSFEVQIVKKIKTRYLHSSVQTFILVNILIRVVNFLHYWIRDHPRDFEVNGIFRAEVSEFIEHEVAQCAFPPQITRKLLIHCP